MKKQDIIDDLEARLSEAEDRLMAREAMLLKLRVKQHLYGDSPELAQKILAEDLARAAD